MPFGTVGDAGPYKENLNFLMRSTHYGGFFVSLLLIGRL